MTLKFQIIIIGIIIISLIVIIYGQYKGKIEYRFALGWSALSVVILVFSIWPKLLEKISKLLGIYDPVNMLMFFAILLFRLSWSYKEVFPVSTAAVSYCSIRFKDSINSGITASKSTPYQGFPGFFNVSAIERAV